MSAYIATDTQDFSRTQEFFFFFLLQRGPKPERKRELKRNQTGDRNLYYISCEHVIKLSRTRLKKGNFTR